MIYPMVPILRGDHGAKLCFLPLACEIWSWSGCSRVQLCFSVLKPWCTSKTSNTKNIYSMEVKFCETHWLFMEGPISKCKHKLSARSLSSNFMQPTYQKLLCIRAAEQNLAVVWGSIPFSTNYFLLVLKLYCSFIICKPLRSTDKFSLTS